MIPTILPSLQIISYLSKQPSPTTATLEFLEVCRRLMGGRPSIPSPPRLYPPALQLKLYQAFIFSVPILFSIILVLLFYLFYLKRRASSLSAATSPTTPPWRSNQAAGTPLPYQVDLKEELKAKLPIIMFDEDVRSRESQCCVCLGEFEVKEQLHQIPSCNHLFHIHCIHHWLHTNTTCPLCRGSINVLPPQTKSYPPHNLVHSRMDAEADHPTNDLEELSPDGTNYSHQLSVVVQISTIHTS